MSRTLAIIAAVLVTAQLGGAASASGMSRLGHGLGHGLHRLGHSMSRAVHGHHTYSHHRRHH